MQAYKPRRVEFNRMVSIEGWNVKVYQITYRLQFESRGVLDKAILRLPEWLEKSKTLGFETYRTAFLIVHEGRDGVWTLLNWWTGGEMLQSITFYTDYREPKEFQMLPKEGFMACVWELAVTSFEREMWIKHILKKAGNPDFNAYLEAHLNAEV
jgi:hypothetical protein